MVTTPRIHPEMQALIDARAAAPAGDSIAEQRLAWTRYTAALARPHPVDMRVYDTSAPVGDHVVPVRVYRPAGPAGPRPAIVYLHGGGFMKGDLDSSDAIAWGFAQGAGAIVVSVDYRLTPEHPFPAAFDDSYGVLAHLAAEPGRFDIDARRIAVAGDSAGGNLTAALSLAARDRGGPPIVAQAIIYAGVGLAPHTPASVEFAHAPGLTAASIIKYHDLLHPAYDDCDDPRLRPIAAKSHAGLPPALIHSAEIDPLRDDGRAYAATLAQAGSWVTYREARGMIHGFMRARFTGPAAAAEFAVICDFLRAHLAD